MTSPTIPPLIPRFMGDLLSPLLNDAPTSSGASRVLALPPADTHAPHAPRSLLRPDGGGWLLVEDSPPPAPPTGTPHRLLRPATAAESAWADAYTEAQAGSPPPPGFCASPPASLYAAIVEERTISNPLSWEDDPATWAEPSEDAPPPTRTPDSSGPVSSPAGAVRGAGRVALRVLTGGAW